MFRQSLTIILTVVFAATPVLAAEQSYPYDTGDVGTAIITGGDQVFIVIRLELWGEGAKNDPGLATRWE